MIIIGHFMINGLCLKLYHVYTYAAITYMHVVEGPLRGEMKCYGEGGSRFDNKSSIRGGEYYWEIFIENYGKLSVEARRSYKILKVGRPGVQNSFSPQTQCLLKWNVLNSTTNIWHTVIFHMLYVDMTLDVVSCDKPDGSTYGTICLVGMFNLSLSKQTWYCSDATLRILDMGS